VKRAARGLLKMQDPKNHHLGTIAQLCRAISSQLRHVSTIAKNLLSSNISFTYPHNTVNFGPLTAEIGSTVWGTPANFNWFRVLASLHPYCTASSSGRQPNFAALKRGRHLCSAGRSSRWALAHILVIIIIIVVVVIIMAALRSRCGHYIFALWFVSSSFSA